MNRRDFLAAIAASPLSCAPDASSDTKLIAEQLRMGACRLLRKESSYQINQTLYMPAGAILELDPGVVVEWTGARAKSHDWVVVANDGCRILAQGAEIRTAAADSNRWAVCVPGKRDVVLEGVRSFNLGQVYTTLRPGADPAHPDFSELCRNVKISGGGAAFDRMPVGKQTTAACFVGWADGWVVQDVEFRNVPSGIQWWGGDASPRRGGLPDAARLCRNGRISNASVRNVLGAGIWGSMGQAITIADSSVADCQDVGCDAEGSFEITWERCRAARCANGAFAEFNYCRNISYIDCEAVAAPGQLLLAFYGERGAFSEGSRIIGGNWSGTAPYAKIAIVSGGVRGFTIDSTARLSNATVEPSLR